jgi:hypothetical protein
MRKKLGTQAQQAFARYEMINAHHDALFERVWDLPQAEWPTFDVQLARSIKRQERAFKEWIKAVHQAKAPRKTRLPF